MSNYSAYKFSRWMPPKAASTFAGWCALAVVLAILFPIWPLLIIGHVIDNRYLRRLALERAGEDIGTFARAFDRRREPFDPWVIRATWDALEVYVRFGRECLPLRPTDRLVEDLRIDPDDVDLDLICDVAKRSGHTLDKVESNPIYGRIVTVGDFVRFSTLQPRVSMSEQRLNEGASWA